MAEEHNRDARAIPQKLETSPAPPELTSALLDLARLAKLAGAVRTEQGVHNIASALLTHLLSLCAAQRGAVLLVSAQPASLTALAPEAQGATRALRLVARQGMPEHEVFALAPLLPSLPSDLSTIQGGSEVSCWLLYHCSLEGAARDQRAQDHQAAVSEPGEPAMQAYLLLGWDGMEGEPCTASLERSRTILSRLSDAIEAVLSSMQLAVRLEELETKGGASMRDRDSLSSDLLAVVSHELRSPLTAIKGYASTLLRHGARLAREERAQFLLAISEASDQLDRLVGRMLELAELENGSMTFAPVPVDPVRLAEAALLSIQQRVARQAPDLFTFQLRLETPEGKEATSIPFIEADPRLLREALDTLLDNAVKYSPEGGVITVFLRPTTDERITPGEAIPSVGRLPGPSERHQPAPMLEIGVRDQGIGIPAAHITRVFERFYQVDRGLTRGVSGAGLGLTICELIVERHRGRIWVESRPGEGSTFHLVIPILQRSTEAQEPLVV
jgi:signal transduction histidine kinase